MKQFILTGTLAKDYENSFGFELRPVSDHKVVNQL